MNVLIIGGKKGIGAALARQLLTEKQHTVIKTSRSYNETLQNTESRAWTINCDLNNQSSIAHLKKQLEAKFTNLDWVINCAGVLHTDQFMPEKTLQQINPLQMNENFMTNAVGHLLIIKALKKLITHSKHALVCSISARIGSIQDNQLGGWYAYRMSKAALNMGIKTTAIEWSRQHPHVKFLLLHPGTTDTELSAPFQRRLPEGQLQSPEKTAELLLKQMKLKQNHASKHPLFLDYNGTAIEW